MNSNAIASLLIGSVEQQPLATAGVTDNIAPTWPAGTTLTVTDGGVATEQVLTWTAATDNIAVTGYNLYKGTVLVADMGDVLTYTVTMGVEIEEYSIRAYDAAGNESDQADPNAPAAVLSQAGSLVVDGETLGDATTGHAFAGDPTLTVNWLRTGGSNYTGAGETGQWINRRTNSPSTIKYTFNRPVRYVLLEIRNAAGLKAAQNELLSNFKIGGVQFQPDIQFPTSYFFLPNGSNMNAWGPPEATETTAGSGIYQIYPHEMLPDPDTGYTTQSTNTTTEDVGYLLGFGLGGASFTEIEMQYEVFNLSPTSTNNNNTSVYIHEMRVVE